MLYQHRQCCSSCYHPSAPAQVQARRALVRPCLAKPIEDHCEEQAEQAEGEDEENNKDEAEDGEEQHGAGAGGRAGRRRRRV